LGVVDVALGWIDQLDVAGESIVDSTGQSREETAETVFDLVK
jgi:hypothetical protein